MPSIDQHHQPHTSSGFVRKYLSGIFMIICLIVLSVFLGFSYKSGELIREQLRRQGQAFFQEVVLTRDWAANHGGVYVRLEPGVEVNPYLLKVPGLKVVIKDEDGQRYTLKNPALMTREISELAAITGLFHFRITSLKPLNPNNAPDAFEKTALERFNQGVTEYYVYEDKGNEVLYRYMAPLVTRKPCLRCHEFQGYREGDIRGGISVTIAATDMMHQLRENQIYLVVSALAIVALVFAIIRYISLVFIKDIRAAEQRLIDMTARDFLTGLFNRREALGRLAEEFSRSRRSGNPLSVILLDIDHFKQLNDTYGHSLGDEVLKEVARRMEQTVRDYDIICRYGGEEFLIAAPETGSEAAFDLAERIRMKIMEMLIPYGTESEPVSVTISAGVTQLDREESIEKMISRADAALYRAKNGGRNRVELL